MGNEHDVSSDPRRVWRDANDLRPLRQASEAEAEALLRHLMDDEASRFPDIDSEGPLPRDVISENTLIIVLIRTIRVGLPGPLEARVRRLLEDMRYAPDRHPNIQAELDAFLNTRRR